MKKMKSISAIALVVVCMLGFYQCTNDEDIFTGFPIVWEYENLQQVHDEMNVGDTIQLAIADPTIDNTLNSPGGTELTFPANSLTLTGGGEPSAPLTVSLIEVYKRGDMIRHNMQTFENQSPLISGGALWLRVTDATGAEVNFTGVQTVLPYNTDAATYEDAMQYYAGMDQMAPSGVVTSWASTAGNITFDGGANTFTIDETKAGWSSIASPQNIAEEDKTQISVQIPNVTSFQFAQVYFVSNDLTKVAALMNVETESLKSFIGSIKNGSEGKIVGIALIDGKLSFASQDVTITGDDVFTLNLAQGTSAELQVLLNNLN